MHIRARVLPFVILLLATSSFAGEAVSIPHKGIVPIIGTTSSGTSISQPAFQSTITLYGKQGLHGRLVFHPAGQVANDDTDPTYHYLCAARDCVTGDVSGLFGKGPFIGSMDIIPDPDSEPTIPMAYTRIYYSQGGSVPQIIVPLGTDVPRVISDEWAAQQQSGDASQRFIYVQGMNPSGFRTTLGMRTLTPITYSVSVVSLSGVKETIVSGATLPADFTYFVPLQQVLGSRVLANGDDVRVDVESGLVIGFYSYTSNNASNTPTFRLSQPLNDPLSFGGVQ
ncbi:MAG TPA: hypothetical protein VLC46_07780 [Thermoanaerobaculia bacterium]|jgi:hypothetical protein|nr:hypothetical protein [Thermoanaerobaculia bacterium]